MTRIYNDTVDSVHTYETAMDVPSIFFGARVPAGDLEPWSKAAVGSLYLDRLGGGVYHKTANTWQRLLGMGANTVTAGPGGTYPTLSAAIAAVSGSATASNPYLVVVVGPIVETTTVNAANNVHVLFLPGASVTIQTDSGVHGINVSSSVTNSIWAGVTRRPAHIVRAGTVTTGSLAAISINGGTLTLFNINAVNQLVSASATTLMGCYVYNQGNLVARSCTFTGGNGTSSNFGLYCTSRAFVSLIDCECYGGGGGTAHGAAFSTARLDADMCWFQGGNGGNSCYGLFLSTTAVGNLRNCRVEGGSGGSSGFGLYLFNGSFASCVECICVGGRGGTGSYGGASSVSSTGRFSQCVFIGGGANPLYAENTLTYAGTVEQTFQPGTGFPWRLTHIAINVTTAAAAGVTMNIYDASGGGGNLLCGPIAVDSTGYKYVPVSGHRIIAANGFAYARLSAADNNLVCTVSYTYETCYGTSYSVWQNSDASSLYLDCSYFSNAASATIYVTTTGTARARFEGGSARSGWNDAGRPVAFQCQTSWNPGQVFNMALAGGSLNLTAAPGTTNGSNVEIV